MSETTKFIAVAAGAAAAGAAAAHFWHRARATARAAGPGPGSGHDIPTGVGAPSLVADGQRIAVFCGASLPKGEHADAIIAATETLGQTLVRQNVELVYGGGNTGLMGVVSNAVDAAGGVVHGVIPAALQDLEGVGEGVQVHNRVIVDDMHQRKAHMAKLASGFIALPGGFGTLEELFEAVCWTQLNIQRKPIGILNLDGYYDAAVEQIERGVEFGFIRAEHAGIVLVDDDPGRLVARMLAHEVPEGYNVQWAQGTEAI